MRTKLLTLTAAAAGLGILMTGCGNAPGSVADDPLALKLVDAQAKMESWGGADIDLILTGSGALSGKSLPCIAMTSTLDPEEFHMQIITDAGSGSECSAAPDATGTKQVWYSEGTMYVTESDSYAGYETEDTESCEVTASSHTVSGELATEFAEKQTQQANMADLMQAATDISGDDRNIAVVLDTETVAELGKTSIPSGTDADDVDTSMNVQLDAEGALESLDLTVEAEGVTLDVHTIYAKPSGEVTVPEPACVTDGEPYTSMSQVESALT